MNTMSKMYIFALAGFAVIGISLFAAMPEPHTRLLGAWEAEQFKTNYEEFAGAKKLSLFVYRIEVITPGKTNFLANLVGEFVVTDDKGTDNLPYVCFPMTLIGTNKLLAGPRGEGLLFKYLIDDNALSLEIEEIPYYFKGKLRKLRNNAGQPRFLPEWAR